MLAYVSVRDYFPYHNIPLVSPPTVFGTKRFFPMPQTEKHPKTKEVAGYARDHWK
jgi:hypothetical protein